MYVDAKEIPLTHLEVQKLLIKTSFVDSSLENMKQEVFGLIPGSLFAVIEVFLEFFYNDHRHCTGICTSNRA